MKLRHKTTDLRFGNRVRVTVSGLTLDGKTVPKMSKSIGLEDVTFDKVWAMVSEVLYQACENK